MEMENDFPSIDLCYQISRNQNEIFSKWTDSLDNKTIAVFSTSTLLIGIISAFQAERLSLDLRIIPFIIAMISFLIGVYFAWQSLRIRTFMILYNPQILLDDYAPKEPSDAKEWLLKYDSANFEHNHQVIDNKANSLDKAIVFMGVELVALVIWLIFMKF